MCLIHRPLQCSADSLLIFKVISKVSSSWHDDTIKFITCSSDFFSFN